MYGCPLLQAAHALNIPIWLENPAQLKLSSGVQRGKNDPLDATRIAEYARRFCERARLIAPEEQTLAQLRYLISERRLFVADRGKYKAQLRNQKGYMPAPMYAPKAVRLQALIASFEQLIRQIEQQMRELIHSHPVLARQDEVLQSVTGVGPQLACYAIVTTQGFTRLINPRKLSCHAGVAPFVYHSGINTYSRARVSHRADKQFKTLLHMAALSVIRSPGELQEYYLRKVEEGKPKMCVLNARRSKLIHRMIAVVQRDEKYVPFY